MSRVVPGGLELYLVLDSSFLADRSWQTILCAAIDGGVDCVQLRGKNLTDDAFVAWALQALEILRPRRIPLLINDRIEVAQRANAQGVHLGQTDQSWSEARRILGPQAIIGLSVESEEQVRATEEADVDYLGVSAIFPTATKTDLRKIWGLEGLQRLRGKSRHPLIAIGGINAGNIQSVFHAGADGAAVVSAICGHPDPGRASRELKDLVRTRRSYRLCLTIAGSDSGAGAGLQADLKTFAALGVYGLSAITAVTAQNTCEVRSVAPVPTPIVVDQIECVLQDIGVDAVKIGMLHSAETIRAVAETLRKFSIPHLVLDPVMISSNGCRLLQEDAIEVLRKELIPMATVLMPNLPEARVLLGCGENSAPQTMIHDLLELGSRAVLLKGGHADDAHESRDFLYERGLNQVIELEGERVQTRNTHGTGCMFSSAVAAFLAKGLDLPAAARFAKDYVSEALKNGSAHRLGQGSGPGHHFHAFWET